MTVYILKPNLDATSLNRKTAQIGFDKLGEETILFTPEEFDVLTFQAEDDIVVGGIGYAKRGMRAMDLVPPALEDIPVELLPFAGRRVWTSTIKEARQNVQNGARFFVKPSSEDQKLFDGAVWSCFRDLIPTAHIPDDTLVACADPVNFIAEYRGFILNGELLSLRPYRGNPLAFPNPNVVKSALSAYRGPAAFSMDFGVTDTGQTLVVEINDSYALGAYGLPPIAYAKMIRTRWNEIRRSQTSQT